MVAGRKPKPTHLKLVTGNPGRRPVNQSEAKIPPGMPGPPAYLMAEARTEWRALVPDLYNAGLLTKVDRSVMAAYCQALATMMRAQKAFDVIAKKDQKFGGYMIRTKNGNVIQNPMVGILNRAWRDTVRFAAELGITPSARSRVEAKPPPKDADPAEEFGL